MKNIVLSFLCLFLSCVHAIGGEKVRLLTEDFPPFGYRSNGQLEGIGPEIVRNLMLSKHVNADKIEVLPWKRAYRIATSQENVGLFSMHRIPQRESQFKWVGPLYSMQGYLFARNDFPDTLHTLEEAKSAGLILVQDGGASETELISLGFTNLLPMVNPDHQLRMLLIGRADLYYSTDVAIRYQLEHLGSHDVKIKPVLKLAKSDFYLAFSKMTSDRVVEAWQNAVDELRENGDLERLRSKYLVFGN